MPPSLVIEAIKAQRDGLHPKGSEELVKESQSALLALRKHLTCNVNAHFTVVMIRASTVIRKAHCLRNLGVERKRTARIAGIVEPRKAVDRFADCMPVTMTSLLTLSGEPAKLT